MIYYLPLISIMLGYIFAISIKQADQKRIKLLLAYSGAFLLSFTVLQLLPEIYHNISEYKGRGMVEIQVGSFIMIGILFQIILEFFSKGAEHGHVHVNKNGLLNKIPWPIYVSLCFHALLEGLPVSHHNNMVWGISIHHFPVALILTVFFTDSSLKKKTIFLLLFVFAIMTPFGTMMSVELEFVSRYYTEICAVVVGVLFHISSTIIYESNEAHKFNITKLVAIILGFLTAFILKH